METLESVGGVWDGDVREKGSGGGVLTADTKINSIMSTLSSELIIIEPK